MDSKFKLFQHVDNIYFLLYFTCGLSVIAYENIKCYIKYYKKTHTNLLFLEGNLYENNFLLIDKWYITHLLFYTIIGYLYRKSFYLSMILGVIWESFEFYLGYYKPNWFFNFYKTKYNSSDQWYGRITDIIINYMGFYIGYVLNYITA